MLKVAYAEKWNLHDIVIFLQVAETLNISRAAERLGLGQPAVSHAVQRLETYFGVLLLDRFKTGVRLTAAGKRLLEGGHHTLSICSKLKDQVLAAEHTVEGNFTLGCHPSVAIYCLPTFLKAMLAKNDKLTISLMHGLSREILEAVVSFRADFGIVVNPVRHPDLVVKELCCDRVTLWSVADANTNVIVYVPSLFQSQTLIDQLNRNGQLTKWLPTSDLEVAAALTASGVGIGILPTRVAKRMASLSMIENAPFVDDTVCLVYRADLHISAARRHIINVIRGAQF